MTETTPMSTPCGWCLTNQHDSCIGEFQSSLTTKYYRCPCTHPAPTPATRPATSKTQCLCCGEPTRGGRFRPGHDSRYLKKLASEITKGRMTLEAAIETLPTAALADKLRKRVTP